MSPQSILALITAGVLALATLSALLAIRETRRRHRSGNALRQ